MYEVKNAATFTDTIELNAAALPILMSANKREIMALTRIEYKGSAVGSWTWRNKSDKTKGIFGISTYARDICAAWHSIIPSERP